VEGLGNQVKTKQSNKKEGFDKTFYKTLFSPVRLKNCNQYELNLEH
jgi:hypothetical protein